MATPVAGERPVGWYCSEPESRIAGSHDDLIRYPQLPRLGFTRLKGKWVALFRSLHRRTLAVVVELPLRSWSIEYSKLNDEDDAE